MGPQPSAWWRWETDGGTRAVVLTDTALGISGELTPAQVADLDEARHRGRPLDADLGRHGLIVELDQIVELRLGRDDATLELALVDGVTSIGLRPPDWSTAAGLFEELRRRRAPMSPVRATMVNPGAEYEPGWWAKVATTTLMAATGGAGALLCVFAAVETGRSGDDAARDGALALVGSVFAVIGFVPALVCFTVTLALAVGRLVAERSEMRHRHEIRHEILVAVPAPSQEPVDSPEPSRDALSFSARPDGIDPLADLMDDPARR